MSREQLDSILKNIKKDILTTESNNETDKIVFISGPLYEWLQFCLIIQQEDSTIFGTKIGIVYSDELYYSVGTAKRVETGWKL